MSKYPWAANREKLERAIGVVGHEASEDEVKAEYVRIAGLVLNDDGTKSVVKEVLGTYEVKEIYLGDEEQPKKEVKKSKKK